MHPTSSLDSSKYFDKQIMSFMGYLSNSYFPFMKQLFIVVANNCIHLHLDKIQADWIIAVQVYFPG